MFPDLPMRVTLTFPDGERADLSFAVLPRMTIPQFRVAVGELLGIQSPIVLRVSPGWDELSHLGAISAHVFSGSALLCPRLKAGSIVQVRRSLPSSSDV